MKTLLTSFEQTTASARTTNCSLAPEWRLIFGTVCRTLVRAHGRSLLPESSCPGEDRYPLRGAVNIRFSAKSKLYRNASLHDEPGGSNIEMVGKAEAGSGGDQPAEE